VSCSYVLLANMFCISSSKHRPKTVFEVIAELWNSPDYNPVAPPSDCHMDFQMATVCSYADIAGLSPATPQRVEDIFTSMRRDLLLIMRRWEQSGQGEGGRDNSDDDEERHEEHREEGQALSADAAVADRSLGSLSGRPARALQSRAAFLNGKPPYLLYFWEVADTHQLLCSSLQCLNNATGASDAASAAPSSHQRKRRRGQEDDDTDTNSEASYRTFLKGLNNIAESQRQSTIDRANDRQHERQLQTQTQVFRRKTELLDLARSYRKLNAELDPRDERSARLSDFYLSESRIIEQELHELENQQPQEAAAADDSTSTT
jgi:hypothetical protein